MSVDKRRVLSGILASLGAFSMVSGHSEKVNKGSRPRSRSQFSKESTKIKPNFGLNVENVNQKRPRIGRVNRINRDLKDENVKNRLTNINPAAKNVNLLNVNLSKSDSSSNWWGRLPLAGKLGIGIGSPIILGGTGFGAYFLARYLIRKFGNCDFMEHMKVFNDNLVRFCGSDVLVEYEWTDKKNYKFLNIKFYLVTNGKKGVENRKFYLISRVEDMECKKGKFDAPPEQLKITSDEESLCYEINKNGLQLDSNLKERRLFEKSAGMLGYVLVTRLVAGKMMKDSSKLYDNIAGHGTLQGYAEKFILNNSGVDKPPNNDVRFYVLSDKKINEIKNAGAFTVTEIDVSKDEIT